MQSPQRSASEQTTETARLDETPLLDDSRPRISRLVEARGCGDADTAARSKAVYEYVRDEIRFGYNLWAATSALRHALSAVVRAARMERFRAPPGPPPTSSTETASRAGPGAPGALKHGRRLITSL